MKSQMSFKKIFGIFFKRFLLPTTAGVIALVFLWRSFPLWTNPFYASSKESVTPSNLKDFSLPPTSVITFKKTPLSSNAQPFNAENSEGKKRIAFILSEVGEDVFLTQKALELLPKEVTIVISPHTPKASDWAKKFHQKGHEILASIDLEPENYPLNDPGPQTILTKLSPQMMESRLSSLLKKVPYALGVTHESGNLFVTQAPALKIWLQILQDKGLSLLDMVLSPQTLIPELALKNDHPFLMVDSSLSRLRLTRENFDSLVPKEFPKKMIVISLPLSEKGILLIQESLSQKRSPAIGMKKHASPIALIPFSFALKHRDKG